MAFLQWRRFNFFEKTVLSDSNDQLVELAKSGEITCSSSGDGFLIFGDSSGNIWVADRKHQSSQIKAYEIGVTHCCTINKQYTLTASSSSTKFYIVTIGSDTEDFAPVLKVWQVKKITSEAVKDNVSNSVPSFSSDSSTIFGTSPHASEEGPPTIMIRSIRLTASSSSVMTQLSSHATVTAISILDDKFLAVGFNDGNCLIIKGDLTRDKNLKMHMLDVMSNGSSISGLSFGSYTKTSIQQQQQHGRGFKAFNAPASNIKQHVFLFVCTRNEISSFDLTNKSKQNKFALDSFGCDIGCSCLKRDPKQPELIQFIVGRNEAIYFYNIDGRGSCLAFDGRKLFLHWFRNYLVVITVNDITRANFQSNGQQSATLTNDSPTQQQSTLLNPSCSNLITIYDIARKFIAFSGPIPAVNQVIYEWGNFYLITTDRRVLVFTECDTQTKLELLFRKNQFSLAIDLAKAQSYNQDSLSNMFKQYGDHLYQKGDFDGAIAQYCQTIGVLEPSYVIRKFLDLQRIHNLTLYLQELHKRGVANEDHTTLLINCYVKLKDEEKLNEFLRSTEIVFDAEIAIRVLRQAGFYDNAALLAKRHVRFDSYFSILLEEKSDSITALEAFQELLDDSKQEVVAQYLSKYGRLLMADQPDRATELLKLLCSHRLREMCRSVVPVETDEEKNNEFNLNLDLSSDDDAKLGNFKPEQYLHIFLNNPAKLIEFLEFIIDESNLIGVQEVNKVELSPELSNTLLEMYLHAYKNEIKEDGLAGNEIKVMNFLKNELANYDFKKAMILCQMANFMPGVLYLYEKMQMFKQILAHFISRKDSNGIIEMCTKYGEEKPNLWVDALWYFSENYDDSEKARTLAVIEQIERHKLLPPLMVVEILSKHGKVTLGVVRNYLVRWIQTEKEQIEENEKAIDEYKKECDTIREQIRDIKEKPKVFQATKCSACSHELELPSIHFLCGHSYHQTCFESYVAENDQDCPLCLPENRKILNEISTLDNVKNVNEMFQQEILKTSDPFNVIAKYCSQGLFNPLTVVADGGGMPIKRSTATISSMASTSTEKNSFL